MTAEEKTSEWIIYKMRAREEQCGIKCDFHYHSKRSNTYHILFGADMYTVVVFLHFFFSLHKLELLLLFLCRKSACVPVACAQFRCLANSCVGRRSVDVAYIYLLLLLICLFIIFLIFSTSFLRDTRRVTTKTCKHTFGPIVFFLRSVSVSLCNVYNARAWYKTLSAQIKPYFLPYLVWMEREFSCPVSPVALHSHESRCWSYIFFPLLFSYSALLVFFYYFRSVCFFFSYFYA